MHSELLKIVLRLQSLLAREDGQDTVEYSLVASLIAVASVAALRSLATPITSLLSTVAAVLNTA